MKKFILLSISLGLLPFTMVAQDDDLYFKPKKVVRDRSEQVDTRSYSGSNRDVDEYNRRGKYWSHYQVVGKDAKGNDIIQMQKGWGVYPDSTYMDTTFVGKYYDRVLDEDDFRYSQRMSRWDGFYDPWYARYAWGYGPYWNYGSYWSYGSRWNFGWYGGYYDPWFDPWFDGYYGGYYGVPYYGYAGWYGPRYYGYPYYGYPYYGGSYYVSYSRPVGTRNHSYDGASSAFPSGTFGGSRATVPSSRGATFGNSRVRVGNSNPTFGGSRATYENRDAGYATERIPSRSYNNNPSQGSYQAPTRSFNSGSFGGGSSTFGSGVHSGGSFGGGSTGGGGFHSGGTFGNRR